MNLAGTRANSNESPDAESKVEYSSREVSPPALLLQQLLRAHRIFLLHHSPSLAELYGRLTRPRFCHILKRYWDHYVFDWNLLLNGNPAVDVFNGLKLAAGGELGIGVGEEEWGSGEREVLEDFTRRTEGLVDLIVSRFGDSGDNNGILHPQTSPDGSQSIETQKMDGWQGDRRHPRPSDGVIFSGIGAITRCSIKDVSSWVELLYKYGRHAYGVQDNPAANRRRKEKPQGLPTGESLAKTPPSTAPRKLAGGEPSNKTTPNPTRKRSLSPPKIPAPIVRPSTVSAEAVPISPPALTSSSNGVHPGKGQVTEVSPGGADTLIKYLTLGVYGSRWRIPARKVPVQEPSWNRRKESKFDAGTRKADDNGHEHGSSRGYFLIGLQGELEPDIDLAADEGEMKTPSDPGRFESASRNGQGSNERTILRTLLIQRYKTSTGSSTSVGNAGMPPIRLTFYRHSPFATLKMTSR